MAEDAPRVETIAEHGDIILVVGSAAQKLLVSSAVLKSSSPVFATLLSSRWNGGQELAMIEGSNEIHLPEDKPSAISDMCKLLHGHRPATGPGLVSAQIFELSQIIDKYACTDTLYYQSQAFLLMWLDNFPTPTQAAAESTCRIVAASYLLNQPQAFRIATAHLTESFTGDFAKLASEESGMILPTIIFFAMEGKRNAAFNTISNGLPLLGMPKRSQHRPKLAQYGSKSLNYDEFYLDKLCDAFRAPTWPPDFSDQKISVSAAIEKIRLIGTIRRSSTTCESTGSKSDVTIFTFKRFSDEVAKLCTGLCLQCIKADNLDLLSSCSNASHKQKII